MDILNVQVRRIDGDLAELFFNPREADLRVGETLTLHERATGHSVIAQVIAFRSASFPSLILDQLHHLVGPEQIHAPLLESIGVQLQLPDRLDDGDRAMGDIKVALAKIRKTVRPLSRGNGEGLGVGVGAIGNSGTVGFPPAMSRSCAPPIEKSSPTRPAIWVIACA